MQIIRDLDGYAADADLHLSIGVFDGVHIGHRALLADVVRRRGAGGRAAALTFERHPHAYFHPEAAPRAITTLDEKINLLDACGLDSLFLLPFDRRIAELEPAQFLRDLLARRLRTKSLAVGSNWRFGKDRAGDCALARRVLEAEGCAFHEFEMTVSGGEKISSSRIRALIESRRFAEADTMLGEPYVLRGIVTPGEGRGHVLGFPTANLAIAADKLVPPDGVYRAVARHDGFDRTAIVSIGTKPTFGGSASVVEAYLLEFGSSIYGEQLALRRFAFMREQARFDGADALVRQMQADVASVREG